LAIHPEREGTLPLKGAFLSFTVGEPHGTLEALSFHKRDQWQWPRSFLLGGQAMGHTQAVPKYGWQRIQALSGTAAA